jgi:hypothetical protein
LPWSRGGGKIRGRGLIGEEEEILLDTFEMERKAGYWSPKGWNAFLKKS